MPVEKYVDYLRTVRPRSRRVTGVSPRIPTRAQTEIHIQIPTAGCQCVMCRGIPTAATSTDQVRLECGNTIFNKNSIYFIYNYRRKTVADIPIRYLHKRDLFGKRNGRSAINICKLCKYIQV